MKLPNMRTGIIINVMDFQNLYMPLTAGNKNFTYIEKAVGEALASYIRCYWYYNGYAYLNGKPGIGVDFDEKVKKYPPVEMDYSWMFSRLPDGTVVRP